ncbi:hypothetical protein NVP1052A_40 [Vibrio phage 1.052.A._10N.286.46.C3]|nr:hypothetical protein NVP1052A_40 [Vibrio phage 1.052.A._10N.286.46.C3]
MNFSSFHMMNNLKKRMEYKTDTEMCLKLGITRRSLNRMKHETSCQLRLIERMSEATKIPMSEIINMGES